MASLAKTRVSCRRLPSVVHVLLVRAAVVYGLKRPPGDAFAQTRDINIDIDIDIDDFGDSDDLSTQPSAGFSRNCIVPHRTTPSDGSGRASGRMTDIRASTWTAIPPESEGPLQPVKIALLFFTKTYPTHSDIWLSWLDRASAAGVDFNVHMHAYGFDRSWMQSQPIWAKYLVRKQAQTSWCHMWPAEMLLLETALQDPNVTHVITISHDSIPLKSLSAIYQEVEENRLTRMCGDDNWYHPYPRAESWWLMQRRDAKLFVDHPDIAKEFQCKCTEEQAWYFPLKARMERWGNQSELLNECITFTDWRDGPKACKAWGQMVDETDFSNLRSGDHSNSGFMHPVAFFDVSAAAMAELVSSPFWFARKFIVGSLRAEAIEVLNRHT